MAELLICVAAVNANFWFGGLGKVLILGFVLYLLLKSIRIYTHIYNMFESIYLCFFFLTFFFLTEGMVEKNSQLGTKINQLLPFCQFFITNRYIILF